MDMFRVDYKKRAKNQDPRISAITGKALEEGFLFVS